MSRLLASQRYKRHEERWKRYEKPQPGHRVQVDVKFVARIGGTRKKHYEFTAIYDCTRRSRRTSTISTARTEAWVAKLPTSDYAKRPKPMCNRPSSVAQLAPPVRPPRPKDATYIIQGYGSQRLPRLIPHGHMNVPGKSILITGGTGYLGTLVTNEGDTHASDLSPNVDAMSGVNDPCLRRLRDAPHGLRHIRAMSMRRLSPSNPVSRDASLPC